MNTPDSRLEGVFWTVTERPGLVLTVAIILVAVTGLGLRGLVKDTSVEAFIPPGHASLKAEDEVVEVFGLSDPVAIALITRDGSSVFDKDVLELVAKITDRLSRFPNVRPGRIRSLATESSISGDGETLEVKRYIDPYNLTADAAADARQRWRGMEAHHGTLVSDDETGTVVMADLTDQQLAADTYEAILDLTDELADGTVDIHVAGPGAVSGFLSRYIDRDARKLQPLVFILVIGFIYLAFRRITALPGPMFVVAGSTLGAMGIMGWAGIPYFAITNALPVIIVAVSVADSIHILSAVYQRREQYPHTDLRRIVVVAMADVARPITLTTVTTIAGFTGIAAVSIMPPITWFAVFAGVGIALAWLLSMSALPNLLLLVDVGRSPAFASWRENRPGALGRFLSRLAGRSRQRHRVTVIAFAVLAIMALAGAMQLRIDRSQVENFASDEPIRIADEAINGRFAGTAFLDVIIDAGKPDGLLNVEAMTAIRNLQSYFESLPHVRKTVSIVDYLGELDAALNDSVSEDATPRSLPEHDEEIGEYLFVYEISGDPTDLDEEIDGYYRSALVRGVLSARYFSESRVAVNALESWLDSNVRSDGIKATLAGNVNVGYHWMESLKLSHFKSVLLSLLLVYAASAIFFRSVGTGAIAVIPVAFTVLVLYACMGLLGIYLEPATSMFAAIALGVGVDFAIHLVDRLLRALEEHGNVANALDKALPPVARACFFNSAALALGFSVLMISDLPTLTRFGGLVTLAAVASYLTALVIVPPLFAIASLRRARQANDHQGHRRETTTLLLLFLIVISASPVALAAPMTAEDLVAQIDAREEGVAASRRIRMTLTDRRDRVDERVALVHKLRTAEARLTRVTFIEPKRRRGFAFLSREPFVEDRVDERWMFLPRQRRTRRIPPSNRGDSFFGTDFSYDDIQSELKFDSGDWRFQYGGEQSTADGTRYVLSGTPNDERIAAELGYGAFSAVIDEGTWLPLEIRFTDRAGRPLKTIEVLDWTTISGIHTPLDIRAINHQTGHRTRFEISDIEYPETLPDRLFDQRALARGLP